MKTFYCVTSTFYDDGRVTAGITATEQAVSKPQNFDKYTSRKSIYNDWFESVEEARDFIEETKIA